jgi:hypothetical protein
MTMGKDFSTLGKINRWGRKFVFATDEGKRPSQFRLTHKSASGKVNEVQTWDEIPTEESAWKLLQEEILSAIQDDCEGMSGMQTYILFAEIGDKILSRLPIRQAMVSDDDDEDVASEPATAKGLVGMLMRHLEANQRTAQGSLAQILKHQHMIIETYQIQQEKFEQKYFEMLGQREHLLSEQHRRDIESKEQEANIANRQEIVGKVVALLPAIAKKFTGVSIEGDVPIEVHEFRGLMESMSEEEVEGLKAVLSPEKLIVLLSLMEKNATAKAPKPGPNSH